MIVIFEQTYLPTGTLHGGQGELQETPLPTSDSQQVRESCQPDETAGECLRTGQVRLLALRETAR